MYNNADIIATLSGYIIRPQQRRIFALLCTKGANGITQSVYKGFAEYCNHMRRHRDISGKILVIKNSKYLYSDIYGYSYKYDEYEIINYCYRDRMYHLYMRKSVFNNGNYINAIINNNRISMYYTNEIIDYYSNGRVQYFWGNKKLIRIIINVANSNNVLNISLVNNTAILRDFINNINIFNIAI